MDMGIVVAVMDVAVAVVNVRVMGTETGVAAAGDLGVAGARGGGDRAEAMAMVIATAEVVAMARTEKDGAVDRAFQAGEVEVSRVKGNEASEG